MKETVYSKDKVGKMREKKDNGVTNSLEGHKEQKHHKGPNAKKQGRLQQKAKPTKKRKRISWKWREKKEAKNVLEKSQ